MSVRLGETLGEAVMPAGGPGGEIRVGAPLGGWVTPLEGVPDPVFAGRILGDGVAIDPFETVLRAPCAGVVLTLHRAHHALTLRTDEGAELLMHIGLDTVKLKGEGFTAHVAEGQRVAAGDPLVSFDLATLSARVPSLMVPVILTNPDAFAIATRAPEGAVAAGGELMRLRPLKAASAQAASAQAASAQAAPAPEEAREDVLVRAPDGLHARPAGLVVQAARDFSCEITLRVGARSVSARSAVAIMGLGVECGQTVTVLALGPAASAAVKAVSSILAAAGPQS